MLLRTKIERWQRGVWNKLLFLNNKVKWHGDCYS